MAFQKALIVDDSKLARITLKKKLETLGLTVALVESGAEALANLDAFQPDIVFMDHLMPEMDGFEATQKIRAIPAHAALPVVMCTGKEHHGYLEEARAIGANNILSKPPVDEALQAVLMEDYSTGEPATADEEPLIDLAEWEGEEFEFTDEELGETMEPANVGLVEEFADLGSNILPAVDDNLPEVSAEFDVAADDIDGFDLPEITDAIAEPSADASGAADMGEVQQHIYEAIVQVKAETKAELLSEMQAFMLENTNNEEPAANVPDAAELASMIDVALEQKLAEKMQQAMVVAKSEMHGSLSHELHQQLESKLNDLPKPASVDDISLIVKANVNEQMAQQAPIAVDNTQFDEQLKTLEVNVSQQLVANKAASEGLLNEALASLNEQANQQDNSELEQQLQALKAEQQLLAKRSQLPKHISSMAFVLGLCALGLSVFMYIR